MSRFQFVADNSTTYPVKRLCQLVEIQRTSYYAWKAGRPARAPRAAADAELAARIRVIHAGDNTVGAPRVTVELNEGVPAQERVNRKRVARVMRQTGIVGYVKRRRVRTAIPEPADLKVPDRVKRDFTAARAEPALCRRHHLPAARDRGQPVSGDRDRLLLPPTGRLGGRRPHAHQPGRRRPHHGRWDPGIAGRRGLSQRPRLRPPPGTTPGSAPTSA